MSTTPVELPAETADAKKRAEAAARVAQELAANEAAALVAHQARIARILSRAKARE